MDSKSPSSSKPNRLPSFKARRDLTLSSSPANNKAKFAPNLNVQRRKKTSNDADGVNESNRSKNSRLDKSNNNVEGRSKRRQQNGRAELVRATEGAVFADGLANVANKGGSRGGRSEATNDVAKPVVRKNLVMSDADRERERERLKALLKDDFVASEDMALREGPLPPVQLPMIQTGTKFEEPQDEECHLKKVKKKKKNVIDSDDDSDQADDPSSMGDDCKAKKVLNGVHESSSSSSELDLLSLVSGVNNHSGLLLTQLPDHLPVLMSCKKEEMEQNQAKTSKESDTKMRMTRLRDLPDGLLGRLRVRRSGRAELVLGDQKTAAMQVELGTKVGFLQDLVSVTQQDRGQEQNSVKVGDMTVLGHVNHRLIVSPNFAHLLKEDEEDRS